MPTLPEPSVPHGPENGHRRPSDGLDASSGCLAASDAQNGPQTAVQPDPAPDGPPAALDGLCSAPQGENGAQEGHGAPRAADGRTADPGDAAPGYCPACGRGDCAPTGEQLAAAQRDAAVWRERAQAAEAEAARYAEAESADAAAGSYAHRAENAERDAHRLRGVLAEVLACFVHKTNPGRACLQSGHVSVATVDRWRAVLNGGTEDGAS